MNDGPANVEPKIFVAPKFYASEEKPVGNEMSGVKVT
jgi:hypothetical protein